MMYITRQGLVVLSISLLSICHAWVPLSSFSSQQQSTSRTLQRTRHLLAQPTNNADDDVDRITTLPKRMDWENILRDCRSGIVCAIASAFFFVSPLASFAESPPPSLSNDASFLSNPAEASVVNQHQQQSIHDSTSWGSSHILLAGLQQKRGAVLQEVWAIVDKYALDRNFNNQDWKQVKTTYEERLKEKDADEMKLTKEMVQSLGDKYSRVLDAQQYAAIQKYDLIGVGVTLMPNAQKEIIVGAPPVAGSAADKAGLMVGDKVLRVNGMETKGRTAFDIIDQIAEAPNAKTVTMTIESNDNEPVGRSVRDVVMGRQFLEIKNPIRYKLTETRADGTKVGLVRISEFNSLIKANLEDALKNLQAQGANAFVIDLRMNGGGAFQSAVEVSSFFFEDRVATYVVDGTEAVLPFKSAKGQRILSSDTPVVIWVDGGSASASEVLAASLHDNCRAVIMGDKSFGKGLIQAVYGLKNGAGLVLTVAKYVTPSQAEIQGVGISPDINGKGVVPPPLPGIGMDTSKVNFADIRNRLSSNLCTVPEPRTAN